jgi:heterodisulfide reductase subunit B
VDLESIRKCFEDVDELGAAEPAEAPPAAAADTFAYLPGAAAEVAREYDASIRALAKLLDIKLVDLDDWNDVGGRALEGIEPEAAARLARRDLALAGGRVILSGCPITVAQLRRAGGPGCAMHLVELLLREDVREGIAAKIRTAGEKRPVGSLEVACYTGGAAMPSMEGLMELAGAKTVGWGGMLRPHGGMLLYARPDVGFAMLEKIFRDFERSGADAIVTADPLAHFNLDAFQYAVGRRRRHALAVPVFHVTEVLALAMGLERTEDWLERHLTSPFPLVDRLIAEEDGRKEAEAASERGRRRKDGA